MHTHSPFGMPLRVLGSLGALIACTSRSSAQTVYSGDTTLTAVTAVDGYGITNGAALTVTGAGSLDASGFDGFVGYVDGDSNTPDTGTLLISAGGRVTNLNGNLGGATGTSGTATVTGAGSVWTNTGYLNIANNGSGTLTISDGASVTDNTANVGHVSGVTGNITVETGATWTSSDSLLLGMGGTGILDITTGGAVSAVNSHLGYSAGGVGTATITGADSSWTSSNVLHIGQYGSGTVTIADGGKLALSSGNIADGSRTIVLGYYAGSSGTLNLGAAAGSTAATAGYVDALTVKGGAGTATLQFNTTGTTAAPTYFTTTGAIDGTQVNTAGSLTLVHTAGTTLFGGDLAHTGGTTINGGAAYFGGTVASAITVNSGATLGGNGTLNGHVTLNSGAILDVGALDLPGALTLTSGLTLASGSTLNYQLGAFDPQQGSMSDQLIVSAGTLTFNGTLTLNLSDSGTFTGGTYDLINAQGATIVGWDDDTSIVFGTRLSGYIYTLSWVDSVLQLTASSYTPTSGGSAVPEPSTYAALTGLAAFGFVIWRRRRAAA